MLFRFSSLFPLLFAVRTTHTTVLKKDEAAEQHTNLKLPAHHVDTGATRC